MFSRVLRTLKCPPRIQLFEFCDSDFLPRRLREVFMQSLNMIHTVVSPYTRLREVYLDWGAQQCDGKVLDLASGGGDHIASILKGVNGSKDSPVTIVLSDLYPQEARYRELQARFSAKRIDFISEPVDAMTVMSNQDLPQGISLFTGMHHFKPEMAQHLVSQTVENGKQLFIAEFSQRSWFDLLLPFVVGLPLSLASPFVNLFRGKNVSVFSFFVCCIIPIVPLMVCFDGIVSVLRIYRKEDIESFLEASGVSKERLKSGSFRCGGVGTVSYYIVN